MARVRGRIRRRARVASRALAAFLQEQSAGGLLLMGCAAVAMAAANSPLAGAYFALLHAPIGGLDLLHWINDGLMAVFFLLVGLEIKREFLDGELSDWPSRVLPGLGALGGIAVPALIYLAFNAGDPQAARGWAVPGATDIAFALGVLALLGSRAPVSLKIFLTALAVLDDLAAIGVIALFYTDDLTLWALAGAAACLAVLIGLNRLRVTSLWPYLLIGAALWAFTLKSGVHATIAGVLLAMTIPLRPQGEAGDDPASPLHRLEHAISPWVAFAIVPVFGLANAGVALGASPLAQGAAPVTAGVALGLLVGKQLGVFLPVWAAISLGWASRPAGASWLQLYGIALLCGVGFTMSLFITALAFPSEAVQTQSKIGVLAGSLASGVLGYLVLRLAARTAPSEA